MAISIVQSARAVNQYPGQPVQVTLPAAITAGSYLVVCVEAAKTGYPYGYSSLSANTPNPIVIDNKGAISYTLVDSLKLLSQDALSSPPTSYSTDMSGYFPSAYVYIGNSAATAGTQTVSVAAFYQDEVTSPLQVNTACPPVVSGRPVFDGGINVQVCEVAGLSTGVDQHAHINTQSATLGAGLITTSAAAIIFELGILIDSSTVVVNTNSTLQHSQNIGHSSSSHFILQTRIVGGSTASTGFGNALQYPGGVIAASFK